MKCTLPLLIFIAMFLLSGCTIFDARQSDQAPVTPSAPLTAPVGKNWQIIEEAPKLSNDQGRLPFQSEQSVQPEGARPIAPVDNRKIETPR
jgi:hypothetical protein